MAPGHEGRGEAQSAQPFRRDPLAALIMCGPFKVDYSLSTGAKFSRGEFTELDDEELLASHPPVMARIYKQ